jgi:hypothetical protein
MIIKTWYYPRIPKVERDNIPQPLKSIARWVIWRAGLMKPNGKFDKVPCSPASGRNIDGQDPKNWLTYHAALAAYDQGKGDGIGIVLSSEHTVTLNGTDFYLVALDFDHCAASMNKLQELWLHLGTPYAEVSPSGKVIFMAAISTTCTGITLTNMSSRSAPQIQCTAPPKSGAQAMSMVRTANTKPSRTVIISIMVKGRLHHPHGDHCDDHGPVQLA